MKNFILALIICACCSVSFANDCCGLRCRQPVRNVVGATVGVAQSVVSVPVRVANRVAAVPVRVAERVASAPVRVVRRVVSGVQCRRCNRRCR